MLKAKLQDGSTVSVPLNQLENFLDKYLGQIEVQSKPMRSRKQEKRNDL